MQSLSLLSILVCALVFLHASLHWPLVGDASVMHYVVFLMRHGAVPYLQIHDINMPGAYAMEYAAMRLFGTDALGWRLYDLTLVLLLTVAMVAIAGPGRRWAGLFAGGLFLLVHGRDGLAELGQRDLAAAVLLMLGCAALCAPRAPASAALRAAGSGLCLGASLLIKPTLLFAGAAFLAGVLLTSQGTRDRMRSAFALLLGAAALPAACLLLLERWGALRALLADALGLAGYYASLGRKPAAYFLLHLAPSSLLPMALLALGILAWNGLTRPGARAGLRRHPRTILLGLCLLAGVLSFLLQGKALPYHRYPADAFLLLLVALCFQAALEQRGVPRALGVAGCAAGALLLAPVSTMRILHYHDGAHSFRTLLMHDLQHAVAGPLDHDVQCLDFTAGCTNALYDLEVVEATGTLSDCFLFGPDSNAAVLAYRRQFFAAYQQRRPRLLVLSNQDCYRPNSYAKVQRWPALARDISEHYRLLLERRLDEPIHWTSTPEPPYGYRIYQRMP